MDPSNDMQAAAVTRVVEEMSAEEQAQDEQDADASVKAAEEAVAEHRGVSRRLSADC